MGTDGLGLTPRRGITVLQSSKFHLHETTEARSN